MPDSEEEHKPKLPGFAGHMARQVTLREARMIRRKTSVAPNLWRAVGLAGVIGWTVAVPMLVGIAVGTWIDRMWPSRFSWTLMLLVGGLVFGCAMAWSRIEHEREDR